MNHLGCAIVHQRHQIWLRFGSSMPFGLVGSMGELGFTFRFQGSSLRSLPLRNLLCVQSLRQFVLAESDLVDLKREMLLDSLVASLAIEA